jgi:hypothetical protein
VQEAIQTYDAESTFRSSSQTQILVQQLEGVAGSAVLVGWMEAPCWAGASDDAEQVEVCCIEIPGLAELMEKVA